MQTFGNKDTKMYLYDSNDVLLNESDDEGYTINSLIIRFLNANEQYKLKIEFYSSTTYGNTKLAITSPNGGTNLSVNSYIDSYESIATITGADNTRIGCTLATGRTWVTTFVPTQSAEYTIFTYEDDDVDTYLYLIDPRSSELLIYNVNQNDDAGEDFNAQIRSELEAGVKYLIVLSLYNPATIESSQVVFLTIERSGA